MGGSDDDPGFDDLTWADAILKTHNALATVTGKSIQTASDLQTIRKEFVHCEEAASVLSRLAEGMGLLTAFERSSIVFDSIQHVFDNTIASAFSSPTFSMPTLCKAFAGAVQEILGRELSELGMEVLRLIILLQLDASLTRDPASLVPHNALYHWFHRPHGSSFDDWAHMDAGIAADRASGAMPLADVRARGLQVEAKLQALCERLDASSWLRVLLSYGEAIARHRSEWTQWKDSCCPEVSVRFPSSCSSAARDRFLISTAFRNDRLLPAARSWITQAFQMNVSTLYRRSDFWRLVASGRPERPALVAFEDARGQVLVTSEIRRFCEAERTETVVVLVHEQQGFHELETYLELAQETGAWLILVNIEANTRAVSRVLSEVTQRHDREVHPKFRLVFMYDNRKFVPQHIIATCLRMCVRSTSMFRDRLASLLAQIPLDLVQCSSRNDWPYLLHNITFLHCVLNFRVHFGKSCVCACVSALCICVRVQVIFIHFLLL